MKRSNAEWMMTHHGWQKNARWYLVLLVLNVLVYGRSLTFEFVNFDDTEYVIQNTYVHQGLTRESVRWAFTSVHAGYWIPLTWLSFMFDHHLYGLNPAGFHATNLLLHILNTWLVFAFFYGATRAGMKSFAVAALFAIHPLHVESVVWVTERKDVLSTFFLLLALLAYARAGTSPSRRWLGWALLLFCWVLSLMAKGTAVTLPLLLLLLDVWPLGRWRPAHGWRGATRLALEKAPLLVVSAAFAAITVWAQHKGGAVGTFEQYPLDIRLANAAISYVRYIGMTFWPFRLAAFYPHPGRNISYGLAALAALALAAVSLWAARAIQRRPYVFAGWFFYLISLLPMIGIVQVGGQALADRFTYVPLIGLFAAMCWGLAEWWNERGAAAIERRAGATEHLRFRTALPGVALAAILLFLGVRAWQQSLVWNDTVTLFQHALKVTRNNAYPHYNLGAEYFSKGELELAAYHFEHAARIHRKDYEALYNLGNIRRLQGRFTEAVEAYLRALVQAPQWAPLWNNLGMTLLEMQRPSEAAEALAMAIRCDSNKVEAIGNLAFVHLRQGQPDKAIEMFQQAIAKAPDQALLHYGMGCAWAALRNDSESRRHFLEAIRRDPTNVLAYRELANLELLLGRKAEAIRLYRQGLDVSPNDVQTMNNLAYALILEAASDEDRGEAVSLARRACEQAAPELLPSVLDTLAQTLAATKRWSEAAATAEQAAAEAEKLGRSTLAERLRARAEKYRQVAQPAP